MIILPVLVPMPFDEPFDYIFDGARPPEPGSFVRVPFGSRQLIGVVWDGAAAGKLSPGRLKTVIEVVDLPPLPEMLRRLIESTAEDNVAALGSVLRLAMSVPAVFDPPPMSTAYVVAKDVEAPANARQRAALERLAGAPPLAAADAAALAGVSVSTIRTLAKKDLLEAVAIDEDAAMVVPRPDLVPVELRASQAKAAARLETLCRERTHRVVLLEGAPGAGKTEVYFAALAATIAEGRSAIVLLPEIALSAQWLQRFEERFGVAPVVWHSGLTGAARRRNWKAAAGGRVHVVVGARSALFLPLPDVGLIVIDEEHDPSFKQADGVVYDARKVARHRARLEGCPLVLCTATPSLETALACGRMGDPPAPGHECLMLEDRHGTAAPPSIELLDLRKHRPAPGRFIAPPLELALGETLAAGGQSLLFLNRRGYAPLTLCRACGFRYRCPNCSAWLVSHRFRRQLICHHCGYGRGIQEHCPDCGAFDSLATSGPGVERIAEELGHLLPKARIAIMTSDTAGSAASATALVESVLAHEVDVLIGTQLIAKGHHFPDLTLVGVIDADMGLSGGDPRAAERTFQMLYQLAGRAGREAVRGKVLIQTHLPDHPVMLALAQGEKEAFFEAELAEREDGGMPPFGRLAALILQGTDATLVRSQARLLARHAPRRDDVIVLGPAPAPLSLLRGRYRERLLVKAPLDCDLPAIIRGWTRQVRMPAKVRLQVDIDPQSFL